MSLLSWNCRGLGNPRTVRDLRQMVEEKRPRFLFLMETRLRQRRMQGIRTQLGFAGMLTVDPVGTGGGLALLWQEEMKWRFKTTPCATFQLLSLFRKCHSLETNGILWSS
ncbi:hypothetical protein SLA2020_488020 [Shorea laevis]